MTVKKSIKIEVTKSVLGNDFTFGYEYNEGSQPESIRASYFGVDQASQKSVNVDMTKRSNGQINVPNINGYTTTESTVAMITAIMQVIDSLFTNYATPETV